MKVILYMPDIEGHNVRYASHIAEYLREKGDEVIIVTWRKDKRLAPLLELCEVHYVVRDSDERYSGNILKKFSHEMKGLNYCFDLADDFKVDIVHHLAVNRGEFPLFIRSFKRRRHWKLFATFFQAHFVHYSGEKIPLHYRLYDSLSRWALGSLLKHNRFNGLFVHSQRIKELMKGLYGQTQKITVVPDPVVPLQKILKEVAREELGLPMHRIVFLFFGALRPNKGADILFQSLPFLHGDWSMVVAGSAGEKEREMANGCRRLLEEPDRLITHFEFIPEEDMAKYFSVADAVILPYKRSFKGTSGVLQTAVGTGKPVIASDVGDVGPAIKTNDLGIVVTPESSEALARAMNDFMKKNDIISKEILPRARLYAKSNDWRVMAKKVRETYLSSLEV